MNKIIIRQEWASLYSIQINIGKKTCEIDKYEGDKILTVGFEKLYLPNNGYGNFFKNETVVMGCIIDLGWNYHLLISRDIYLFYFPGKLRVFYSAGCSEHGDEEYTLFDSTNTMYNIYLSTVENAILKLKGVTIVYDEDGYLDYEDLQQEIATRNLKEVAMKFPNIEIMPLIKIHTFKDPLSIQLTNWSLIYLSFLNMSPEYHLPKPLIKYILYLSQFNQLSSNYPSILQITSKPHGIDEFIKHIYSVDNFSPDINVGDYHEQ